MGSLLKTGSPAVLTTILLEWFAVGLHPLWPLMWVASLPMLLFVPKVPWWIAAPVAFLSWFAGAFTYWGYFHHVMQMPVGISLFIFALMSVMFALPVLLFRALMRRGAPGLAMIGTPALSATLDYLNSLTSVHGTNGSPSYTQLDFLPALQTVSVTGPWGLSFLLLLASTALAVGISRFRDPRALRIAGAGLAVVALSLGAGAIRLAGTQAGPEVEVALLASDAPGNLWTAKPGEPAERLFNAYADHIAGLAEQGVKVVVLPEKLALVGDQVDADPIFQALADRSGLQIVAGIQRLSGAARFNEARLYTPNGAVATYDKQHMLPPFESDLTPGTALTILPKGGSPWGIAICKDMDFTRPASLYGAAGVGLMLVPAWDFVADAWSHGHMAIMRGVESGYAIVRAAKGGFLTVSDDRGRVVAETPSGSAPFATLVTKVPSGHDATLYLRFGDWFAWASAAVSVLSLAWLVRPRAG
jgi:apolipoprotein N-acyltransferase